MKYILLIVLFFQAAAYGNSDFVDSNANALEGALLLTCDELGQVADEHCVESSTIEVLSRHDYIDVDVDMDKECRERMEKGELEGGPNLPAEDDDSKEVIDYGLSHYRRIDRRCIRRDRFKKCQAWEYKSEFRCFLKYREVK